jgi:hypothetical protein
MLTMPKTCSTPNWTKLSAIKSAPVKSFTAELLVCEDNFIGYSQGEIARKN